MPKSVDEPQLTENADVGLVAVIVELVLIENVDTDTQSLRDRGAVPEIEVRFASLGRERYRLVLVDYISSNRPAHRRIDRRLAIDDPQGLADAQAEFVRLPEHALMRERHAI